MISPTTPDPTSIPLSGSPARRLLVLWAMYFVQGLPYGFQATALPVYLRDAGVSLTAVGFATALSLPWMLKVLWAPLVDRYGGGRFGRRRSWILPLELALAGLCVVAGLLEPTSGLGVLLVLIFLMNLVAATMDIAVDGLAVDLLKPSELGKGNIAQVVGFKIGMLTGGGLLVWASGAIGWQGLFLSMAGLILLATLVTMTFRERARRVDEKGAPISESPSIGSVLGLLKRSFASRGAAWLLIFVGTYKLGETMADTMFKPFLVDEGFTRQQIGQWVGTWGMLCSILGSVLGGLLASRIRLIKAVAIAAFLRVIPIAGEWWLTMVEATPERVIGVTCAEHLFGGALTTALFAFMMFRVDRRIGATHFTLLASVEVWGKVPAGWASGLITDATSYTTTFALATVLSALFLLLLIPVARYEPGHPVATGRVVDS